MESTTECIVRNELQNFLSEQKALNKSYSIRALARDLKIEQAHLTRIINGKKNATPYVAFQLSQYRNFNPEKSLELIAATLKK
jgi:plasmid maintenance system antidote protein VapI